MDPNRLNAFTLGDSSEKVFFAGFATSKIS